MASKNVLRMQGGCKDAENCFESVFLLVGTNDAATPGSTTDSITKDYNQLISTAKKLTNNVVIICPPPRLDSVQAMRKLGMINNALKQISQAQHCGLIELYRQFEMPNNSINESLLDQDGLHLSEAGTLVLMAELRKKYPALLSDQLDVPVRAFMPRNQRIYSNNSARKGPSTQKLLKEHESFRSNHNSSKQSDRQHSQRSLQQQQWTNRFRHSRTKQK